MSWHRYSIDMKGKTSTKLELELPSVSCIMTSRGPRGDSLESLRIGGSLESEVAGICPEMAVTSTETMSYELHA